MTLRDMEYIAAIAEDKSITRASTRLFVAQPALSQCVQKVEKELGVRIFLRESSGVRLTAEGQCYMEFIQKTLHEQKNLHKKLEDLRRADSLDRYTGIHRDTVYIRSALFSSTV